MVSIDSAMIDANSEGPKTASAAAPAFAASWLGYGKTPVFTIRMLRSRRSRFRRRCSVTIASSGPGARTETIRRALAIMPVKDQPEKEPTPMYSRAKSFLFFYGLQDRYGDEVFRNAVRHMLDARRGSGFDLDDMIAAFDRKPTAIPRNLCACG